MQRFFCFLLSTVAAFHAAAQTCASVYSEATRNVDVYTRTIAEQRSTFNEHCETNGSMRSSSSSQDLTIPVKAFKASFSGTAQEARQEMQDFCKTYASNVQKYDGMYRLNDSVSVDALRSFNQCVALERSSVNVSHSATPSRSVVVRVDLNPATTNVVLRAVRYDSNVAQCTSTINGATPTVIVADTPEFKATSPFSVVCDRKPEKTQAGELRFPRFELLIDTNFGPYTVVMPTEGVLNYDLASVNAKRAENAALVEAGLKKEVDDLQRQNVQLKSDVSAVTTKMNGLKFTSIHFIMQGQGAPWPCPLNPEDESQKICRSEGAVRSRLDKTPERGGGSCGYREWKFACYQFP